MRSWYNAEPNTFMRLNDANQVCTSHAYADCARQADAHCHSLRVRRA